MAPPAACRRAARSVRNRVPRSAGWCRKRVRSRTSPSSTICAAPSSGRWHMRPRRRSRWRAPRDALWRWLSLHPEALGRCAPRRRASPTTRRRRLGRGCSRRSPSCRARSAAPNHHAAARARWRSRSMHRCARPLSRARPHRVQLSLGLAGGRRRARGDAGVRRSRWPASVRLVRAKFAGGLASRRATSTLRARRTKRGSGSPPKPDRARSERRALGDLADLALIAGDADRGGAPGSRAPGPPRPPAHGDVAIALGNLLLALLAGNLVDARANAHRVPRRVRASSAIFSSSMRPTRSRCFAAKEGRPAQRRPIMLGYAGWRVCRAQTRHASRTRPARGQGRVASRGRDRARRSPRPGAWKAPHGCGRMRRLALSSVDGGLTLECAAGARVRRLGAPLEAIERRRHRATDGPLASSCRTAAHRIELPDHAAHRVGRRTARSPVKDDRQRRSATRSRARSRTSR